MATSDTGSGRQRRRPRARRMSGTAAYRSRVTFSPIEEGTAYVARQTSRYTANTPLRTLALRTRQVNHRPTRQKAQTARKLAVGNGYRPASGKIRQSASSIATPPRIAAAGSANVVRDGRRATYCPARTIARRTKARGLRASVSRIARAAQPRRPVCSRRRARSAAPAAATKERFPRAPRRPRRPRKRGSPSVPRLPTHALRPS